MQKTISKNNRVLDLYERLCAGEIIQKATYAKRFGINERSVQRDIDDIRVFLDERTVTEGDSREIVYDHRQKGFRLTGHQSPLMTNSEILAVSKILLESRAFSKQEMLLILDKLISGCVPQKSMKMVSDLLANEKFHYVELNAPAPIEDKLWEIGEQIHSHSLLEITYRRQGDAAEPVQRIIKPVSLLFSEYYFYLNAYITEKTDSGTYRDLYDYPAVFRLDRIIDYRILQEKFSLPYASRFQEGEFRKRVQFMYPGELQQIRFRYTGNAVEAILDRLPTAAIISHDESGYVLEAEVFGRGIIMWLLSQGENVEVLAPQKLRNEMADLIARMLEKYIDGN